jgi:prepilin-type N-terminal cleavage/methylation domain-containing protein
MQRRGLQAWRGFSLVELLIVISVIAIMTALALPSFLKWQCKAKQKEAYGSVRQLLKAFTLYKNDSGGFWCPVPDDIVFDLGLQEASILKYYSKEAATCTVSRVTLLLCDRKSPLSSVPCGDQWLADSNAAAPVHLNDVCR